MDELNWLLDALEGAAGGPRALPPRLYRSEALHGLELSRIFGREWWCAGRASDFAQAGAYRALRLGAQPIFVIRGRDGALRAFANICRHRMMRLLGEGAGAVGEIACPYHGWTYDDRGRLLRAAHMKGADNHGRFEKSEHALAQLALEEWEGWVYVSADAEAGALAPRLAPLGEVTGRYAQEDYVTVVEQTHDWATDWKLLTENFMEGYHLPIAHRETVGAWYPVRSTEFPDAHYEAFAYQTFLKTENAQYGVAHRDNRRLEAAWRRRTVMPTVFPSHMYVLAPDHLWWLSLSPGGVGEVRVHFGAALAPEVHEAFAREGRLEGATRDLIAFFDQVNGEDREVVEAIYANTAAPLATAGPLSWLERELSDFHRWLAARLRPSAPAMRAAE